MAAEADSRATERRRLRRLDALDLEYRRRRHRATTPAQRLEEALSLGELAAELRRGVLEARR
ncbi:MAG: hypothetical protein KJ006_10030 [Thermoleophilia bacterium]|nr:hypothetical protein [Thermoleophilia bacterium]